MITKETACSSWLVIVAGQVMDEFGESLECRSFGTSVPPFSVAASVVAFRGVLLLHRVLCHATARGALRQTLQ